MGTKTRVSAAVLVAAVCMYFVTRTRQAEPPRMAVVEPPAANVELQEPIDSELVSAVEGPATEAGRRSQVAEEVPVGVAAALGTNVLRVVVEGITEEDARRAKVTLTARDERGKRIAGIEGSWLCKGLTSEFDLDPFFARVTERHDDLRVDQLEIEVDHPEYLRQRIGVLLSDAVERAPGETVHEVRVQLVRPEFWPEFTLAVRDANTRAHLEDIGLRIMGGAWMYTWGRPGRIDTFLDDGLRSPIALMGGRATDEEGVWVAGLAVSPAAGDSPRLVELPGHRRLAHGLIVAAQAPGYAWGSIAIDVSKDTERELLLIPGSALTVRFTNVQLERYAGLDTVPTLCFYKIRGDGGNMGIRFEHLDETLETEGFRLEGIRPGGYRVSVELGGGSWTERPVLALEEVSVVAGETREVELALTDPPAAPERATLGGVVSLPAFGGEEEVRLQLYFQPTQRFRQPDVEFSLADLPRVGGALPSWSFRAEDLPVGMYRVQLLPFLKVLMVDLPPGGRDDLEVVLPELAEVILETVDGRTGERIPLDELWYRNKEPLPGQRQNDRVRAQTEEPGHFRFRAVPGTVTAWPRHETMLGYGRAWMDFELVPGLQSVRLELAPLYAIRFEFRVDGAVVEGPEGFGGWVRYSSYEAVRAVDHEGSSQGRLEDGVVEVSAPGVYEIDFAGVTADRYYPIPPRRVVVRAGEATEVIVELRRK